VAYFFGVDLCAMTNMAIGFPLFGADSLVNG